MPDRGEQLDEVRQRLIEAVEHAGTNLATLSRALGRNHAYLHQFVFRGSPKHLSAEARRTPECHAGGRAGVPRALATAAHPAIVARSPPGAPAGAARGTAPGPRGAADRDQPDRLRPPPDDRAAGIGVRYACGVLYRRRPRPPAVRRSGGWRGRIRPWKSWTGSPKRSGKSFDWLIRGPRHPQDAAVSQGRDVGRSDGAPVAQGVTKNGNLPAVRASGEDRDGTAKARSAKEGRDGGEHDPSRRRP